MPQVGTAQILLRLWGFLKPYWSKFILGLFFVLLAVPFGQLVVFLTRDLTNQAINSASLTAPQRWDAVVHILWMQAGFWLVSNVLSVWREVIEWYVSMRATLDLRLRYYHHLLRLSMSTLSQRPPGEHLYRATADMVSMFRVGNRVETSTPAGQVPPDSKEVQLTYHYSNDVDPYDPGVMGIFSRTMPLFLETTYSLAWGCFFLWLIDPVISLMMVCYIVPFGYFSYKAFDKVQAAGFEFKTGIENETAVLRDSIAGLRAVATAGRLAFQRKKFYLAAGGARTAGVRLAGKLVQAQNLLQQGMRWVFTIVVYLYLARRIILGQATIGDWVATALLIETAQMPLQNLVQLFQLVKVQLVPVRRILETLDTAPQLLDKPGAKVVGHLEGGIDLDEVDFAYRDGEPVLRGLTLSIKPGEYLGIVGPSGAGKSSLVNLCLRLYGAGSGAVLVDGQDIQDVDVESYLRHVACVPQSTFLYQGTLADNIRFGLPQATDDQILDALRLAGADEFVTRRSDGLMSLVGERSGLSGGERQRIGIARAIVRDPKILFLDEATSALDPETEAHVLATIERIRKGRTVVTVAHRLKAVENCDRIIVLDGGRIVQSGTHTELVGQPGVYRDLWLSQSPKEVDGRGR